MTQSFHHLRRRLVGQGKTGRGVVENMIDEDYTSSLAFIVDQTPNQQEIERGRFSEPASCSVVCIADTQQVQTGHSP